MPHGFDVEDIEALRRAAGIDDVELRARVRALAVGDRVHLTLLAGANAAGETVVVRITEINGRAFRGYLVRRPASRGLCHLLAGLTIIFAAAHIHSVPNKQPVRR